MTDRTPVPPPPADQAAPASTAPNPPGVVQTPDAPTPETVIDAPTGEPVAVQEALSNAVAAAAASVEDAVAADAVEVEDAVLATLTEERIVNAVKTACIADGIQEAEFARDFPLPAERVPALVRAVGTLLFGHEPSIPDADPDIVKIHNVGDLIDRLCDELPENPANWGTEAADAPTLTGDPTASK